MSQALLDVRNLSVDFATERGTVTVVDDVSFAVGAGETLGIVGESGSGKTVTSMAVMGLVPHPPGTIRSGQILLDGTDLLGLNRRELEKVRGRDVSMVFQEPMTSLNPAYTVGEQIAETIRAHTSVSRKEAREQAVRMLETVHIPHAARRARAYPHEFSGGMRQRVVIAVALSCNPRLLIADEPTTALDVTVQAQILELLKELQRDTGLAMLFITHDLGVVADICDRVLVMYAGQAVEEGLAVPTFRHPVHPYTEGLLRAVPQLEGDEQLRSIPGATPAPWAMPPGCRFQPRCAHAQDRCAAGEPPLVDNGSGQLGRCLRTGEITLRGSDG
jgi:peptide/nickel transport system ATP-binding protein